MSQGNGAGLQGCGTTTVAPTPLRTSNAASSGLNRTIGPTWWSAITVSLRSRCPSVVEIDPIPRRRPLSVLPRLDDVRLDCRLAEHAAGLDAVQAADQHETLL